MRKWHHGDRRLRSDRFKFAKEKREENPKTCQNDLIYFLRGSMSALSFPKLPGDVKD